MDFTYTDEQRMLAETAERFCKDRDNRHIARNVDEIARGDWDMFAQMGWLAIGFPEEMGGIGGDCVDMAVLTTALGKRYVLSPFIVTAVLCGTVLAQSRSHRPLVQEVIDGTLRLALAHGEGSPPVNPVTATRQYGGFLLSGQKFQVLSSPLADRIIVSGSMEGEPSPVLFVIDRDAPGAVWTDYRLLDGTSASDLSLNDVAVCEADAIIASGDTHTLIDTAIDMATLAWLGEAVGAMEDCLELCGAYLKERVQFGQPIGSFQALQQIIAAMFVDTQDARSALYFALSRAGKDAGARADAIATAKLAIGIGARNVARSAIQLHGGYGMTDEFIVSHHYRRLMVIEKLFGDLDHHSLRAAETLLGPLDPQTPLTK